MMTKSLLGGNGMRTPMRSGACLFGLVFAFTWNLAPSFSEEAAEEQPASLSADADLAKKLETQLQRVCNKHDLPALWAGKFYADGRSVVAAAGIRKWGAGTPAESTDVVHLGSCTKIMTGVMIARLCSAGKLSFDSTLQEVFPGVPGLTDSPWAKVTVTELLQHRSGAPANANWQSLHNQHPADATAARRELLKWMIRQNRPAEPAYLYSNVGFALLGHIVEELESESWESLIAKRVFEPLGMTSAGLGPVFAPQNAKPDADGVACAWGHVENTSILSTLGSWLGGEKRTSYQPLQIDNPPPLGPAGRVHANLQDWSKFVLLFASENGSEKMDVKPKIWNQLLQPTSGGDYSGGWMLLQRSWADGLVYYHSGSNTTWYCVVFVAPKKHYCLLAATNAFNAVAAQACDDAVVAALSLKF